MVGSFAGESSRPASLDGLLRRMERDEGDLISVGRALLADPLWAKKVRAGDHAGLLDFTPAALGEFA
jgi:2,4-dienoyl-CoA reductase-like NADH-dependent reductase (Old Yellow Enzyme family)